MEDEARKDEDILGADELKHTSRGDCADSRLMKQVLVGEAQ